MFGSMLEVKPRRSGGRQSRAGRNVVAAGLCLFMGWMGVLVRGPYLEADKMAAGNQQVERRMLAKEIDLQRKQKELRALQTDAGMEREARRMGYVKPGEVLLVIPDRR
jgi:hypothetical protein